MSKPLVRMAVFGSYYRGYNVLHEMLHGPIGQMVNVVGVATDDPASSWVSADKRVWQYPHTPYERRMVAQLAEENGIEVYTGRTHDEPFLERFETEWRPDICMMATFGQRIRKRVLSYPRLGFYNLHPCIDDKWPSHYIGGNPFDALMRDGKRYACVVMHGVDEGFDTGPFVGISDRIAIPAESTVPDMHKITAFAAAQLARTKLKEIIESDRRAYA